MSIDNEKKKKAVMKNYCISIIFTVFKSKKKENAKQSELNKKPIFFVEIQTDLKPIKVC